MVVVEIAENGGIIEFTGIGGIVWELSEWPKLARLPKLGGIARKAGIIKITGIGGIGEMVGISGIGGNYRSFRNCRKCGNY